MDNPKLIQLEAFFAGRTLPQTIVLGPGETITDIPKFLDKHFTVLQAEGAANLKEPYMARLLKLQGLLSYF